MREIRSLRAAMASAALPAAKPAWGNPQRLLVAGFVVLLLAAIAAAILYGQFPRHFARFRSPQSEQQFVKSLPTLETMRYFHQRLLPGLESSEEVGSQSKRSIVYLGMIMLAGLGAIGLILVAAGITGIVRRRSRS